LLYHFVFATQGRRPWLEVAWRPRLCEYLGGMVRQAGGASYGINGVGDHLHLLLRLRPEAPLATLMRDWKAYSSRWVHRNVPGAAAFAWQRGYSVFTVSPSHKDRVAAYIAHQEAHHAKVSFEQEMAILLRLHGIERAG